MIVSCNCYVRIVLTKERHADHLGARILMETNSTSCDHITPRLTSHCQLLGNFNFDCNLTIVYCWECKISVYNTHIVEPSPFSTCSLIALLSLNIFTTKQWTKAQGSNQDHTTLLSSSNKVNDKAILLQSVVALSRMINNLHSHYVLRLCYN